MQPGQSYSRTLAVFAPEETGPYWIVVQANSDKLLTEATTANGTAVSSNAVNVQPSYTATVQADVSVGLANTPVPLSGTATLAGGGPAQYQIVNIHIFTGGTDRIISAITDANGLFSAEFQPLPGEAGVYQIGAVNPGVSQATVQGGFDILGMSAQPPSTNLSLIAGSSSVGGQVTLTNLTDIPLSDLQASVVGAPSNVSVSLTLGDGSPDQTLAGDGTLTLSYLAGATDTSTPSGSFTIEVTSHEGATVDIPVTFAVIAELPDVVASPSSLQAGMITGSQTIVQLTLNNDGGAASGPLQVILPSQAAGSAFLSLATSTTIGSIEPGGSTQVTLLLTPPAGLALGDVCRQHRRPGLFRQHDDPLQVPESVQCRGRARPHHRGRVHLLRPGHSQPGRSGRHRDQLADQPGRRDRRDELPGDARPHEPARGLLPDQCHGQRPYALQRDRAGQCRPDDARDGVPLAPARDHHVHRGADLDPGQHRGDGEYDVRDERPGAGDHGQPDGLRRRRRSRRSAIPSR